MNPEEQKCPICESEATVSEAGAYPDFLNSVSSNLFKVNCSVCYSFFVSNAFYFKPEDSHLKHLVQGALRERALKTGKSNVLFLYNDQEVKNYNQKRSDPEKGLVAFTIESLLETIDIPKNPIQQFDRFLQNLDLLLEEDKWGTVCFNQNKDYPLAYAKNFSSVYQLLLEAKEIGYFRENTGTDIGLTMKGWERIEEIKKGNKDSKQGFVACWFDPSHDLFCDAIQEGIKEAGFEAKCIKEEHYSETILEKGLGEIRRSRFVVADLTAQRGSVLVEIGFAYGLGLDVILVCKESEKLGEFYTKNYKISPYKNEEDLENIVYNAVRARISL